MEDVTKTILDDYFIEETPQVDNPDQPKKAIKLARAYHEQAETILKLSNNRWYVDGDANLIDLAEDLRDYQGIPAVAVISEGTVRGIIVRKDLLSILGRPFGIDVLKKENALKICQPTLSFHYINNIFAVSEDMGKIPRGGEVRYFTLHSDDKSFAGIFSSQDLLHYLSENSQKDLNLARAIQNRIVPDHMHQKHESFEVVCSSTMARDVGGDFYFMQNYNENNWAFAVCDVSGKGVAASLGGIALKGAMAGYDFRRGLGQLLCQLNNFFITSFDQEKFVTGIFFDYHADDKSMVIADLGHGLSYIFRQGKLLKMKTADRTYPLGISHDMKPELFKYTLESDDILLVLTDGLLNQTNPQGDEYGLGRVKKVLETSLNESLETLRQHLLEDFHSFRDKTPITDDVTFVLLRPR